MPFLWPTRLSHEFRSSEYCLCIAGWFGLRFALSCSHLLCAILKKYLCGSSWFGLGIALPYIVLRNYFLQLLNMTIKFVPFPLCIETANLLGLFTTPTHISIMIAYLVMFRFFFCLDKDICFCCLDPPFYFLSACLLNGCQKNNLRLVALWQSLGRITAGASEANWTAGGSKIREKLT